MRAFFRSFVYAFQGIAWVVSTQRNARVHLAATVIVVAAGFICRISAIEWAVLALTIGLVFSAEMLNSVAELAVDLLTDRYHSMAKAAKDAGAGAVLVAAIAAVGVGIAIFGPRLWGWLFR